MRLRWRREKVQSHPVILTVGFEVFTDARLSNCFLDVDMSFVDMSAGNIKGISRCADLGTGGGGGTGRRTEGLYR